MPQFFSVVFLFLSILNSPAQATTSPILRVSPAAWRSLNESVGGRMFEGTPLALACSGAASSVVACGKVQAGYTSEEFRTSVPGGFVNSQWETCQATGEQCLLDYTNTSNRSPILPPRKCSLGSVSNYFIDVKSAQDIVKALAFSKKTKVPLVIKNTGHDYKGRSSAPNSIALWTHNLKNITYDSNFVAEGCSEASRAVTMGAGVQWDDAYAFAESHNITLVGGSDKTVGVSGWLQGGGHSLLSNTMGLGVDRVIQFKLVTPDGQLRTANACQNQDLFFALRGGGGGTFGVVLESTHLASPAIKLQVVIVSYSNNPNATLAKEMWSIMADNALKWSSEGWGAISRSEVAVYVNPKLNAAEAAASLDPLIQFGHRLSNDNSLLNATCVVMELPSWGAFFNLFANSYVATVGQSLALASRLVSKGNFETALNRSALVSGLLDANAATRGLIILMTTPASFPGDGQTSVTEAWRSSLYHITVTSGWNWNSTTADKQSHYTAASQSIDNLRKITPDAAYSNEADVYEPNHEVSFWGTNYARLLSIKQKYDPDHLLDCWHCVGWNSKSPRFSCYL